MDNVSQGSVVAALVWVILTTLKRLNVNPKLFPLIAPIAGVLISTLYSYLGNINLLSGALTGLIGGTASTWFEEGKKVFLPNKSNTPELPLPPVENK